MKKLYKIGPLHDGTHKGLRIHWQQDIYFHAIHLPKLQEILKKHVGNDMTIPNMERVNQDLHQFFNSIKRDMYLSEEYVPYSMSPYILLQKGKEEIYRYQPPYGGIAVSTVKKETQLDKVEKKVDRLAKHIGKLTNELKKADKGNEKKSNGIKLSDLPEIHLKGKDTFHLYPEKVYFTDELDKILEHRKQPPKRLKLLIDSGNTLLIAYTRSDTVSTVQATEIIGHINSKGKMHMLNTERKINTYQEWQTGDSITPDSTIDQKSAHWKGYDYAIVSRPIGFGHTGGYLLKNMSLGEDIYNITFGTPCSSITDQNIQKYAPGTPILF